MDTNTEAILRLAFARQLGLPDEALDADGPGGRGPDEDHRVAVVADHLVMTLRLWRTTVVLGPARLQGALSQLDEERLADPSTLLALAPGGRLLGSARLSLRDDLDHHPDLERLEVDPDPAAAAELERHCPPDDVTEVGLVEMATSFVHRSPEGEPRAGSGYDVWAGLVANLGVLTAPSSRRRGLARVLAGIALNDALDAGLVPLWRARIGSTASERLGARLGFEPVGSQLTVLLATSD